MSRLSGTATGAASGAAAGAALGPWGAAAGGVVGGVLGYFGSGNDDDAEKARADKEAADAKAAADYLSYRDSVNQAHMRATANQESFFDQSSSILNSMNGGQGAPDIAGHEYRSPMEMEGLKPAVAADTAPQYGNAPMPTQNAPQPLSFVPRAK